MKENLIRCYYDDMSVEEAIKFIESVYDKKVSTRTIKIVKNMILKCIGKSWN